MLQVDAGFCFEAGARRAQLKEADYVALLTIEAAQSIRAVRV